MAAMEQESKRYPEVYHKEYADHVAGIKMARALQLNFSNGDGTTCDCADVKVPRTKQPPLEQYQKWFPGETAVYSTVVTIDDEKAEPSFIVFHPLSFGSILSQPNSVVYYVGEAVVCRLAKKRPHNVINMRRYDDRLAVKAAKKWVSSV